MPQSKDPSDLAQAIEALESSQAQVREKLAQLDRDRGWLLVLGLIFAGLLGATNFVSVPFAADRQARSAAKETVDEKMGVAVEQAISSYLEEKQGQDFIEKSRLVAVEADLYRAQAEVASTKAVEAYRRIEDRPARWPAGGYCILKSGLCPDGFTTTEGSLKAIEMYRGNTPHLNPAVFGDSHISRYNSTRVGSETGFHGELVLALCCKSQ